MFFVALHSLALSVSPLTTTVCIPLSQYLSLSVALLLPFIPPVYAPCPFTVLLPSLLHLRFQCPFPVRFPVPLPVACQMLPDAFFSFIALSFPFIIRRFPLPGHLPFCHSLHFPFPFRGSFRVSLLLPLRPLQSRCYLIRAPLSPPWPARPTVTLHRPVPSLCQVPVLVPWYIFVPLSCPGLFLFSLLPLLCCTGHACPFLDRYLYLRSIRFSLSPLTPSY